MPPGTGGPRHAGRGHRLVPHTADCMLEAWGQSREACLAEAMTALVEVFAQTRDDVPAERVVPLAANAGADADVLVAMLEEVIFVADVFGCVPVRVHLSAAEDGGVSGDMVVVDAGEVELIGPVPKGVSYHRLEIGEDGGRWSCRAVVDV